MLDPDITSTRRVARVLLYRPHGAREAKRAKDALGLRPDEDTSAYWEEPSLVEEEIKEYGFALGQDGRRVHWEDKGPKREPWLSYTDRVAKLARFAWSSEVPKCPCAFLSTVPHAEVLGLSRNLAALPDGAPELRPRVFWLWLDAYLSVGALLVSSMRAAEFFALQGEKASLSAWMSQAQAELQALRPAAEADTVS